ncbi:MAG: hypothetical protein JW982_05080 [Spirochaetes bacterium]|nr:hypothetical protein [Spirochaetota bacterium]
MLRKTEDKELMKFLNDYNSSWLEKGIEKVKLYYPEEDSELIYFDNHKKNDTTSVCSHLKLINDFFQNGKKTESGTVEEILMEDINFFRAENSACICYLARYKSFPAPAVRTTMYLEKISGLWKIKHIHCSFKPV